MVGKSRQVSNLGGPRPPPKVLLAGPENLQKNAEKENSMEIRNTTLDDIASVIGFSATLRLVAWFGDGTNLYVPLVAEDDCLLARLLGLPMAKKLCETWPGEHLAVPRLRDHEDDVRKRFVARTIEKGFGTREIAGMLRVSERRVQQILRELEVAGLVQVAGPVRKKTIPEKAGGKVLQENWGPMLREKSHGILPSRKGGAK